MVLEFIDVVEDVDGKYRAKINFGDYEEIFKFKEKPSVDQIIEKAKEYRKKREEKALNEPAN